MLQQYKTNFDMGKNVGWHEVNYVGHLICSGLDLIPTNLSLKKKKKGDSSSWCSSTFTFLHIYLFKKITSSLLTSCGSGMRAGNCQQNEFSLKKIFCPKCFV